jgi:site-specific recombinase XerD
MEEVEQKNNLEKNKELLDEYILWREAKKQRSECTLAGDRECVKQFILQYGDKDLLKISKSDVLKYLIWLNEATYTPRSKKGQPKKNPKNYTHASKFQKKKTVRVFLAWLSDEHGTADLTGEIELSTPIVERQIQKTLTIEDAEKLISGCIHPRDRAMIAFLLDSGVRRGELLRITYGNVQFIPGGVQVIVPPSKNKKNTRRVFCIYATQRMRTWYDCHPLKTPDSYFFCSSKPPYSKMAKTTQADVLRAAAARSGFTDHIYSHLFRHSSASLYAAIDGMNSYKINRRFGWKISSDMGDRYIHLSGQESDDNIRRAFGKPVVKKSSCGDDLISCPTCHATYHVKQDRCENCGRGLSPAAIQIDEELEAKREAERIRILTESVTREVLRSFGLDSTSDVDSRIKNISNIIVQYKGRKKIIDGDALYRFLEAEEKKDSEERQE